MLRHYCRRACTARLDDRRTVESLYVTLEVQMKMYYYWSYIITFPLLVNFGFAVIICLYVPLGRPEVPAWLSFSFLLVGATSVGVIFVWTYDIVLVGRASEEVLGKLKSFHVDWRERGISDLQRRRFLKRAKACRPIQIPIGSFGDVSLDVPVIMWDEILNQLLFLLSF